jgi:hypothetical protein
MHATQHVDFSDVQLRLRRLDEIGWGIFLIMIGTIMLVPSVPQGTWLIGTGVLLLLLNAIRYRTQAGWSGFSTVLGVLALVAGLSELIGIKLPLFAICLVVLGVSMVIKPLVSHKV